MRKVEVSVLFNEGSVIIGKESYTNLKEKNPEKTAWKKLKNILTEGPKRINNKVWKRRCFKVKHQPA